MIGLEAGSMLLATSGAWLLLGAGAAKVMRPSGTAPAIRVVLGFGSTVALARVLGAVELALAAAVLIAPGQSTLFLLGIWCLLLSGGALLLRRRKSECGCFGARAAPVTPSHVVTTFALGGVSLIVSLVPAQIVGGAVVVLASAPIAIATFALLNPLPALKSEIGRLGA